MKRKVTYYYIISLVDSKNGYPWFLTLLKWNYIQNGLKKYIGEIGRSCIKYFMAWRFCRWEILGSSSIERNRNNPWWGAGIDKDNVEEIIDSRLNLLLLHREDANQADYAVIHNTLQKIQQWKKPLSIFTDNCVIQNRLMKKLLVVL
jgi:hypothetical protein